MGEGEAGIGRAKIGEGMFQQLGDEADSEQESDTRQYTEESCAE
jgi:hypothetical protein